VPREQIGQRLVEHFLRRWETDDSLLALLRAAVTNDVAAERMREIFAAQVAGLTVRLIDDPAQAAARAGLISSQILGLALCRYALRLPPVAAMPVDEVVGWLGPTVQRYLFGATFRH
jgi:hypothetical protein